MPIVILAMLALMLIAWFIGQPRLTALMRRRRQEAPFPSHWRAILRRRVPIVATMPTDLQLQLKRLIQVFLAEKAFIGCQGQIITDEVRVTIAAQACLLLLNRQTDFYPNLRQILVYPEAFMVDRVRTDAGGVVQSRRDVLSGESWSQGQVILSWHDTVEGAAHPHDGRNVVLHEFAHQLDYESGHANGAPDLGSARRYAHWSEVMKSAYASLRRATRQYEAGGPAPLLDPYGASDPAEFFAVATEVFFEQPRELAAQHPALYRELAGFYAVSPATW